MGILTFFIKYNASKKREKIKYLIDLGNLYTQDPDIKNVLQYLEKLDNEKDKEEKNEEEKSKEEKNEPQKPDRHQIEMFMRFFEELNILIKSNAINKKQAFYLFGYYTLVFDKNKDQWSELNYKSIYWREFREFVGGMKKYVEEKEKQKQ